MNFTFFTHREDLVQFKRGGKTVTLYHTMSRLQLHDLRFGSILDVPVFLEAVVRMTTHLGLVSIFAEPRKRTKEGKEEGEIPRKVIWVEKEKSSGPT